MAAVATEKKRDAIMENAEKKRKNAEPAGEMFDDALERVPEDEEEKEPSATGSTDSSTLPGSASTTGASTYFEITVLGMLKGLQKGQEEGACKTEKNRAGITEVNAKVDEGRKETAALGKRVDSQGKHFECVAAKMLKMELMLRNGSAPVFQMSPVLTPEELTR